MSVYHQITKLTPLWHFPVTANIVFCWKQSGLTWFFCGLTQMPDWPQLLKFPHILTLLWFSSRYTSKCRPKEVVWCEEANSALSSADNPWWIKPHFFATVVSVWLLGYLDFWICRQRKPAGKSFPFAKSMHWISGPSPHVTQHDGTLDKGNSQRVLFCACANVGQWAQDHYDRRLVADLLMRETTKKGAKANFPYIPHHLSLL